MRLPGCRFISVRRSGRASRYAFAIALKACPYRRLRFGQIGSREPRRFSPRSEGPACALKRHMQRSKTALLFDHVVCALLEKSSLPYSLDCGMKCGFRRRAAAARRPTVPSMVVPKTPHCENVIMTFVRFGSQASRQRGHAPMHVRFAPERDIRELASLCPLSALADITRPLRRVALPLRHAAPTAR